MDVKLLVDRLVVVHSEVLDLLVLVLPLVDEKLGQEERVRDVVVCEDLLQSALAEGAEEEELESGGKSGERGVGGGEDGCEAGSRELGVTLGRRIAVVVVVEELL